MVFSFFHDHVNVIRVDRATGNIQAQEGLQDFFVRLGTLQKCADQPGFFEEHPIVATHLMIIETIVGDPAFDELEDRGDPLFAV